MSALTIQFLGTSSIHPLPCWGCDCPQCSDARVDPGQVRLRSSILVNNRVLVDASPDLYHQLASLSTGQLETIRDIIVTHPHADHYLGLEDLAQLRQLSRPDQLSVWAQFDSWALILVTFNYLVSHDLDPGSGAERPFVRRDMVLGQPFEPSHGLSFTPFDTFHTSMFTTAGLVIEQDNLRVVYAPDFYDSAFWGLMEPDLLILDGTSIEEQPDPTLSVGERRSRHLPIVEGIRFAKAVRARQTLFTHIGHIQTTSDQLRKYFPDDTFDVAYDGQVVELHA